MAANASSDLANKEAFGVFTQVFIEVLEDAAELGAADLRAGSLSRVIARRLKSNVGALPREVQTSPQIVAIEQMVRAMSEQIQYMFVFQHAEAAEGKRSNRRLFVLGLVLGFPLGILGSFVAYWLGIN